MSNQENVETTTNETKPKERKKRVSGFLKDFKAFMTKGNVLNLAVAVIMGAAFNAIITSLANDLLMPIIGLFFGMDDISQWSVMIGGLQFNYGLFIYAVVNFIIVAFVLFIIIKIATGTEKRLSKLAKKQRKLFKKGLVDSPVIPAPVPAEAPAAPLETTDDILRDIRRLLQLQEQAMIAGGKLPAPAEEALAPEQTPVVDAE